MGTAYSRQDQRVASSRTAVRHHHHLCTQHSSDMITSSGRPHWRVGRRQRVPDRSDKCQLKAYPAVPQSLIERKVCTDSTHAQQRLYAPHKLSSSPSTSSDWIECMPPSPVVKEFAAVSTQNSAFRQYMEDECVAIPRYKAFVDDPVTSSFFGVYDGHGGAFCAKFAAAHLHTTLSTQLATKIRLNRRDSEQTTVSTTSTSSSSAAYSDIDVDVLSAADIASCYSDAFATVDNELATFDEAATSGSTAVTCLVRSLNGRTTCHVANVGDSRALFYSNGATSRLSVDHKATNADEVKRIKALNGIILNKRVGGVVAVTRALGQADEKPFISSAPHVETVEVVGDDAFVVLVSDGVTDVFTDDATTQFVAERLAKGERAIAICRALLDAAKQQGSMDNMTAVLVRFGADTMNKC